MIYTMSCKKYDNWHGMHDLLGTFMSLTYLPGIFKGLNTSCADSIFFLFHF